MKLMEIKETYDQLVSRTNQQTIQNTTAMSSWNRTNTKRNKETEERERERKRQRTL